MAKLGTMILILIALQAVMILYAGPSYGEEVTVWNFVTNMDNWNSLEFMVGLLALVTLVGAIGIAVGSIFMSKSNFVFLASTIPGFLSLGVVFINLGNMIRDELIAIIGEANPACTLASCGIVNFIIAVTIGPLALYYVWTVVEWWLGKDI